MCAAIACSVLGGGAVWRRRDVRGGPPGRCDYDLEFDDDHVEALEVCAFTEEEAEAQRDALKGRKLRESQVLGRYWLVGIPDRGLDLRALRDGSFLSRAEAHLAVYEAHGRFEFDQADPWKLIFELAGITRLPKRRMRWRGWASSTPRRSRRLQAFRPRSSFKLQRAAPSTRSSVNRAVESRATEPGNLAKLRAATPRDSKAHLHPDLLRRADDLLGRRACCALKHARPAEGGDTCLGRRRSERRPVCPAARRLERVDL